MEFPELKKCILRKCMQVCEAAGRALADGERGFLMGFRPCSEVGYPCVCFDFDISKNYIEFE